jgi:hypothetical protein
MNKHNAEIEEGKEKDDKVAELIANISGILIPISLASITFIVTNGLSPAVRNIFMFTLPSQIILLGVSLFLSLSSISSEDKHNRKYCLISARWCFFIGLVLIGVNHLAVLFSLQPTGST